MGRNQERGVAGFRHFENDAVVARRVREIGRDRGAGAARAKAAPSLN